MIFKLFFLFSLSVEQKMYNLKVENYVLFQGLSEYESPGGGLSESSEGLL